MEDTNCIDISIPTSEEIENPSSIEFECTIGTAKGYNNTDYIEFKRFVEIVRSVCCEVENSTGIYVSLSVRKNIVIYKKEWGCPDNGEEVYVLNAVYNPFYRDDKQKWIRSCLDIQKLLQKRFNQSTVTSVFRKVSVVYSKTEEN